MREQTQGLDTPSDPNPNAFMDHLTEFAHQKTYPGGSELGEIDGGKESKQYRSITPGSLA